MPGGERTEQATPRRRQEAREKGQVAKSLEVNAAIGFLAGVFALQQLGGHLVDQWQHLAVDHLQRMSTFTLTSASLQAEFLTAGGSFLQLALPVLAVSMVVGLASNLLQTGFVFSGKSLAMDFARLNPMQGFTRMFSQRAAMELVKSGAKAAIIGGIIYSFFRQHGEEAIGLIRQDSHLLGPSLASLCWGLLTKAALAMVVIALADYLFQRWQFEKSLRMTKEEVKEEYKRTEGDPLVKSRTRQRQREIARQRMMSDVRRATVVVTNPTHYAIALRYEPGEMAAPMVVAKGQRLIAHKIREVAKEHHIPIVENKPLARALYAQCDIGDYIPPELFQAVAEIIAFVFRQSGRTPV